MQFLLPLVALLNAHGLLPDDAMIMSAGWRGSTVQFVINRPNPDCAPFYWLAKEFLEGKQIVLDQPNPQTSGFQVETTKDGVSEFSISCGASDGEFRFTAWSRIEADGNYTGR